MCKRSVKSRGKKYLSELADDVMGYLLKNSKNFTPRQHIISHMIKNLLAELVENVENGKVKEALNISYRIDNKLIWLYQEYIK